MSLQCLFVLLLATCLACRPLAAQDRSPPEPATSQGELADARLDYLRQRLQALPLTAGTPARQLSLESQPLFRWKNPISGADGAVFVWTLDGRPLVMTKTHVNDIGQHYVESSVALGEGVRLVQAGTTVWQPLSSELKPVTLAHEPPPARSAVLRLAQMRRLAERFEFIDTWGEGEGETYALRLMPRPLYRYACPADTIFDAAVFGFSQGTNPEAIVVIEATGDGESAAWRCGVSRLTGYALTGMYDGQVVLQVPKNNMTRPHEGYRHLWQKLQPYPFAVEPENRD